MRHLQRVVKTPQCGGERVRDTEETSTRTLNTLSTRLKDIVLETHRVRFKHQEWLVHFLRIRGTVQVWGKQFCVRVVGEVVWEDCLRVCNDGIRAAKHGRTIIARVSEFCK